MNAEQTLAELVRIDSRSSVSNLAVVEYAAPRLEALGFCARVYPYTDEQSVKKFQLVAVHPKSFEEGELVELALVGHTDTVPFDPSWSEALKLERRGENLYGRGACDDKGQLFAHVKALESYLRTAGEVTQLSRIVWV